MVPAVAWGGAMAGSATFTSDDGMELGKMFLNGGIGTLNTASFSSGQIDFDMKPIGYDDAGIIFHRRGEQDGEFVYIRANPDCPVAEDCVQYAPITHDRMSWNSYPNYQGAAPISPSGWNHVTLQVADGKMRVFFNHAAEPSIAVPRLLGLASQGGIAFKGPAVFANLVVRPEAQPDLSSVVPEPVQPGTVTAWLAATPTIRDRAVAISAASIPAPSAWHLIDVERTGLVDFSRAFGAGAAPSLSTAWLKTTISASRPVLRTVHIGFAMQASVFLNGRLVYSGNNPYYPSASRTSPGGRVRFDNAVIPLDLQAGRNELVLAIGNDWRADESTPRPSHYGWAAEARFEQADGLDLQ